MWQPIETAPKDNKRSLFLARFNDDGSIQSFDYNGSWESESESWEMPQVYFYWASENGNVEEPTHWAYQPGWFDALPSTQAQPAPSVPEGWKLVPIEPTQEMLDAGEHTFFSTYTGTPTSTPIDVYNAMLAAAPEAKPCP